MALSAAENSAGKEWPATLDVDALLAGGWRPVPFREFVLKVHSRCDLSCDYCYMYQMADQSWRYQPKQMPPAIARQVVTRISEHARTHNLDEVSVVLHGGEPLLAGPDLIGHVVSAMRDAAGAGITVRPSVQTNGARLDEDYLALFARLGLRVGVSLDGGQAAQDRHRRLRQRAGQLHDGGGGAAAAGRRAVPAPVQRAAVRDRRSERSPRRLRGAAGIRAAERRFPAAARDLGLAAPAPGRRRCATPYADWLITIFDRWYDKPDTRVRLFDEIIRLLLGRPSRASPSASPRRSSWSSRPTAP